MPLNFVKRFQGFSARFGMTLFMMGVAVQSAAAQLPRARLFSVFPPGGKQGTTIQVSLTSGADLDEVTRLVFSHPDITMAAPAPSAEAPAAKPDRHAFRVTIAPDVPPGRYELQALGRFGLSNPRSFVVGDRPEIMEVEPNNQITQAQAVDSEVVINGRCEGASDMDCFALDMKAGQRVRLECWAERIDSRMDATLVLYGPHGKELANSRGYTGRDPLIDFTADTEGRYVVKVYDFLYRNGKEFVYRLSAGTGPRIEYIFPPVGRPGVRQTFAVYGRQLPEGRPAGVRVQEVELERRLVDLTLPVAGTACKPQIWDRLLRPSDTCFETIECRLDSRQGVSNSVPIGTASEPIVIEHETNDDPEHAQSVIPPCEFVGQFATRHDRDWITFHVLKDEVYWIEAHSERLGLVSDPFLVLQRVEYARDGSVRIRDVKELDDSTPANWLKAWNGSTEDPTYQFKAAETGTYRLMIRDLYAGSRGSPRLVYRVMIRHPRPDFHLLALALRERPKNDSAYEPAAPLVRPAGSVGIAVHALRCDGFGGPIELTAEGLPEGVTCESTSLGPGTESTMLVLCAGPDAGPWCGPIRIVGSARINHRAVTRTAVPATVLWSTPGNQTPRPTRLTRDLRLAVSGHEKAMCGVRLGEHPMIEAAPATRVTVPIKLERRDGARYAVRLVPNFLPPNVKGNEVTVPGDKSDGTLELQIAKNAPTGDFSLSLWAQTQLDYRRDQRSVDEANRRRDEAQRAASHAATAAEEALAAQAAAEQAKAVCQRKLDGVSRSLARAETEHRGVVAHAAAMHALVDVAVKAAAEKPRDEPLAAASRYAKKLADEAQENRIASERALGAARDALDSARAAVQTAESAVERATATAAEAASRRKESQQALQAAQTKAKQIGDANKPERKDCAFTSNSVRLRIQAESPPS